MRSRGSTNPGCFRKIRPNTVTKERDFQDTRSGETETQAVAVTNPWKRRKEKQTRSRPDDRSNPKTKDITSQYGSRDGDNGLIARKTLRLKVLFQVNQSKQTCSPSELEGKELDTEGQRKITIGQPARNCYRAVQEIPDRRICHYVLVKERDMRKDLRGEGLKGQNTPIHQQRKFFPSKHEAVTRKFTS